ncbi:MAG: hypothetical protein J6Y25_02470 [Elusimicrobiaceae bacterium]|nr:hypothetical protein [Elusimicrobiaceae bacterium]
MNLKKYLLTALAVIVSSVSFAQVMPVEDPAQARQQMIERIVAMLPQESQAAAQQKLENHYNKFPEYYTVKVLQPLKSLADFMLQAEGKENLSESETEQINAEAEKISSKLVQSLNQIVEEELNVIKQVLQMVDPAIAEVVVESLQSEEIKNVSLFTHFLSAFLFFEQNGSLSKEQLNILKETLELNEIFEEEQE